MAQQRHPLNRKLASAMNHRLVERQILHQARAIGVPLDEENVKELHHLRLRAWSTALLRLMIARGGEAGRDAGCGTSDQQVFASFHFGYILAGLEVSSAIAERVGNSSESWRFSSWRESERR